MWTLWLPAASPSMANRNGTTSPSAYAELLPFRSPFCQAHGVASFAHWSRLTVRLAALAIGTLSPMKAKRPTPSTLVATSSTVTAIRLHGLRLLHNLLPQFTEVAGAISGP